MPPRKLPEVSPVDLLRKAKSGDRKARERLLGWAYSTAHAYYIKKARHEVTLTLADAEDLASSFYLEFAKAWPRIHAVYHYTRRMLKNNLNRHLVRVRARQCRETLLSQSEMVRRFEQRTATPPEYFEPNWNDREWLRHRVIGSVIRASDSRTRRLVSFRCADPVVPYREIAQRIGVSEASLRMRMARFYEAVRMAYAAAEENQQSTTGL